MLGQRRGILPHLFNILLNEVLRETRVIFGELGLQMAEDYVVWSLMMLVQMPESGGRI